EQYAAITGGAKAFCSSLSTNFNQVDLDKDVGLKIAKVYAAKKNVSLDTAKTALAAKKTLSVEQRLLDTDFSIVLECINNYNNIMSGEDGADGRDAETAWHAYCAEGNNLSNIITPLYSSVTSCDQFTSEQYNAIMGGAKAYCLSLAQNASSLSSTTGIGKKLTLTLGDDAVSRLQQNGLNATFTVNNESKKFVEACEIKYNEIMAGEKGDNGDTFVPSFNTTTGKITWTKDNNTTSVNDFDIGSTIDSRAVTAVTNQINTSNSTIANTIGSKIDSKITANNNTLLTVDDLTTLITSGAFKMGCGNKLTIDPGVLDAQSTLKAKYGLSPSKINGPTVNTSVCVQ
ncbi:MAG: hypothetical protein J5608_02525, partial [Alphaproteobacteria bacterium]|nr:hypothetical protein [Alphaproteobacteria bacterium]